MVAEAGTMAKGLCSGSPSPVTSNLASTADRLCRVTMRSSTELGRTCEGGRRAGGVEETVALVSGGIEGRCGGEGMRQGQHCR